MSGYVLLAPALLGVAALLPVALLLRLRGRRPGRPLAGYGYLRDMGASFPSTWRVRLRPLPLLLYAIGFLLAVVALARPAVREELPLRRKGLDILLVLDVSSSMQAKDMDPERTRLAVAQDAAAAFIDGRPDDRIGLVTFARYPDLRSPPTRDHAALKALLADVSTVESDSLEDATGIGTAVARATQILTANGARGGVVILLTDGEENVALQGARGEIAPVQAGQLSERLGVRIYPIAAGVGRRDAAGAWVGIDTRPLRDLARRTGGAFHAARDAGAVESVYARIDTLEKAPFEEARTVVRDAHVPFLVAALLAILLAAALGLGPLEVKPRSTTRTLSIVLGAGGVVLGLVALLGPSFGDEEDDRAWGGIDIAVLLDVSRSMLAGDVQPSRLARAQDDVRRLAERAQGDRLSLVAFSGTSRLLVPLTRDRTSLAALAAAADPTSVRLGGTDLAAAIRLGLESLREAEQDGAQMVLLTDGEDHAEGGLGAAERARDQGVTLHAVGYGSPRGSKIPILDEGRERYLRDRAGADVISALDTSGLERLTATTGGSFVRASEASDALTRLYDDLVLPRARWVQGGAHRRPANHYRIPLFLACLLWLLALAWPRGRSAPAAAFLLAALVLGGCDGGARGQQAYDRALAALRAEAWDEAEEAARALEAQGHPALRGPAAFVRGNVAFARSLAAEAAIDPGATDPRARLRAVALAEDALAAWQSAAASREDWPAARRDVERGLRRLEALRESQGPPRPPRRPAAAAASPPPPSPSESEEMKPPTIVVRELAPERVLELLERLKQKEQEKRRVRERERRARGETVERDW